MRCRTGWRAAGRRASAWCPLGTRAVTGIVLGEGEPPDPGSRCARCSSVLDTAPFVPADVVALARWVADYYLAGPGAALAAAVPPHGADGARRRVQDACASPRSPIVGRDVLDRLVAPRCAGGRGRGPAANGHAAARGVAAAGVTPGGLAAAELRRARRPGLGAGAAAGAGLVAMSDARVERDPFAGAAACGGSLDPAPSRRQLMEEQQRAFDTLTALADAQAFSHRACCTASPAAARRSCICASPSACARRDAACWCWCRRSRSRPQVAALFRARFGSQVAIQHSGLSDGERHDQWHRIRRGEVDVVVGTRSAVFAPLARPGLIVVDEEHDTSYKQEETPRYHGRDVAVMRGKLSDALVVLGSATPSMESYRQRARGPLHAGDDAPARAGPAAGRGQRREHARGDGGGAGGRAEPAARRRAGPAARGERAGGHPAEPPRLRHGHVLPPMRPHARMPQLQRFVDHTPRARDGRDRPATEPRRSPIAGWRARCHYCNYLRPVPTTCPQCAAPYLEHVGFGTERIEAEVRRTFPRPAIARVDRDTVRRKGSLVDVLSRFARREVDVLVGTQMIAKGHDFPHVTLVGVVSADVGLGLADFRAAERTFQLLTQVAGRAGRGDARRGHRADAVSDALQHPPRLHAGLRRLLREGDRLSPCDALSAACRDGQRRRQGADLRGGDGRRADLAAAVRRRRPRLRPARAGAGAVDAAARRASRAVLPERDEPRGHARGAAARAGCS